MSEDMPTPPPTDHSAAIERDASLGLTSHEIRDEIIRAVGMMASARTPEMQARYDAAIAREHGQANGSHASVMTRSRSFKPHTTSSWLTAVMRRSKQLGGSRGSRGS
jgi:hypothetical protein